eukprot:g5779.t1
MESHGIFHEKQYLMHCAVHTLNNLFQEPWATASLMEDIAQELFNREATMRKESGMGHSGAGNDLAWYIVDSKSAAPEVVGGASELALHLGMEAREHQGHVFVVSDGECGVMASGGADGGSAEDEKVTAG